MTTTMSSRISGRVSSQNRQRIIAPYLRLAYALSGGNLLYAMLLLNYSIYESSLGHYIYQGPPNMGKIPLAVTAISALAVVLAFAIPHHRSLVGLFSHLCFALLFVPLCAVYTLLDGATAFVLSCGFALAVCFFLFGRRSDFTLYGESDFDRPLMLLFGTIAIFALASLALQGGLSFTFVSFREVYDLRSDAQFGTSILAGRIMTISAYASTSYIMIYGILRRNIFYIMIGVISSYILYCSFGFKLFLFFPIIIIGLYIYINMNNPYSLIFGFVLIFIIIHIFDNADNEYILSLIEILNELIIRRYLYVPGYTAFAWYSTFIEEPYIFLSNVFIINKILNYPFDIGYSSVVSEKIFGVETNANANFMAYGFANFGHFGVLIYSIFVYSMISIVDRCSKNIGSAYLMVGAVAPAFLFLEADPLAVIISFGFGVILLASATGRWMVRRKSGALETTATSVTDSALSSTGKGPD